MPGDHNLLDLGLQNPVSSHKSRKMEPGIWKMEPRANKIGPGGRKMEPGVSKGAREKSRVHEDNPPCGSGSQGPVGPIY